MLKIKEFSYRYIVSPDTKKKEIAIPVEEFEGFMEDFQILKMLAERKDEETIPHEELLKQLKEDGKL
ncbi:MAG: hypothetical protein SCALA702_33400 [Melioribacteraceae bacterium]|nr:MAG: hypothetical protein SCALA702_33400 [Melioribacteraceae bacterium]